MDPPAHRGVAGRSGNGRTFFVSGSERIGRVLVRLTAFILGVAAFLFTGSTLAEEPATKAIVFVPPKEIEEPLRDALTAQLSGVAVELVVEHFASSLDSLRANVDESRSLAAAHQAIGVFWLDARSTDEWLVYLMEPGEKRVLMRRVPIGTDGSVAAVEAVAVITRESTTALLAGQKIGMTEVVVPGEPEKPVPPPPAPPPLATVAPPKPHEFDPLHGFSLAVSYYADLYASGLKPSSGLGLAGSWSFRNGLRAGITFVNLQPEEVDSTSLVLLVRRYPIGLEGGYSLVRNRMLFGVSLRGAVELTSRHVVAPAPPHSVTNATGTVVSPKPDKTLPVVFLSPRLRFDYRVTEAMNLFVAVGPDFALNGVSFVNQVDGVDRPILEPLAVRPAGEVGAVFWP